MQGRKCDRCYVFWQDRRNRDEPARLLYRDYEGFRLVIEVNVLKCIPGCNAQYLDLCDDCLAVAIRSQEEIEVLLAQKEEK